jgi:hypothetical protein
VTQLTLIWRGFLIVLLTSTNVGMISGQHWAGAGLGGVAISFVWWTNARSAAHVDALYARECYALGAGIGTICGMQLVKLIYG